MKKMRDLEMCVFEPCLTFFSSFTDSPQTTGGVGDIDDENVGAFMGIQVYILAYVKSKLSFHIMHAH